MRIPNMTTISGKAPQKIYLFRFDSADTYSSSFAVNDLDKDAAYAVRVSNLGPGMIEINCSGGRCTLGGNLPGDKSEYYIHKTGGGQELSFELPQGVNSASGAVLVWKLDD